MKTYLDRFCNDLPTRPVAGLKVLVTGTTGYIGGELVPELLARGYHVRILVRSFSPAYVVRWPGVEVAVADARDFSGLKNALEGIDCAYYLIHSLHLGKKTFLELDNQMAVNFRRAAEKNGLKRIIYLSGLGDPSISLSEHLLSRNMVAEELQNGSIPVTILRAAVIIGSGSASYKIIKHLVRNCPIFLFPSGANSKCQPIAIRDVIKYLVGSLETIETTGKAFDIGGQDIMTYQTMLQIQAAVAGRKRFFIPSSFSNLKFYAFIASLLTPASYKLIKSLMDSCKCDVVCQNEDILKLIPFQPLTYREAILKALAHESKSDEIHDKQYTSPFDGAQTVPIKDA
ncbi:MAG: NAD(P)H-binding protein [Saprospiraceae bacterium]|nr:NAD(P)H-binding protein [Saprospiraceae bacterium]MCF8248999.1 NAD(P)H-binding protein [Saprospiraceae bacterium]MCF8279210.1 NAD(P)H-binding protein [Bacteroidales bacterium]MCF8310893.1 NAD(P)H-binding protein [Saprospiraceae bacterium]MCF8439519.1 NAD(P)H-binding protein [Saprospiraceae bacterium]